MDTIVSVIISGIAIFLSDRILPGVKVDSFITALIVAVMLAIINLIVKPILFILTLPITILTLGLFTFVLNALMILLVDALVRGFEVQNFWWALLFSLVLSIIRSLLLAIAK